LFTISYSVL